MRDFVDEIIAEENDRRDKFEEALSMLMNIDNLPFFEVYDTLKNEHNKVIRYHPECWKRIFMRSKFLSTAKDIRISSDHAKFEFEDYSVELPLYLASYIKIIPSAKSTETFRASNDSLKARIESKYETTNEALNNFQKNFRSYQGFLCDGDDQYSLAISKIIDSTDEKIDTKWVFKLFFNKEFRDKEIVQAREKITSNYLSELEEVNSRIQKAKEAEEKRQKIIDTAVDNLSEFKDTVYMQNLSIR